MAISIFDACALFGPWPQHDDLSAPNLLGAMSQSQISRSLAMSTLGIYSDFRAGNAATLEMCRQNSEQLVPVATLDPRAYPACLDEADALKSQNFRLVRFFPARQGWPLRFAPFREMLQKCAALNLTVAVEITHAGDATELADAVAFSPAPLLLAGVTSVHLGEAIAVMRTGAKFHLETTHLSAPGALEAVANGVPNGYERLVFASYSPLRYLSGALQSVGAAALSGEQKAAVVGGNLMRLLSAQ